jgi:hypothetical protein
VESGNVNVNKVILEPGKSATMKVKLNTAALQ